MRVSSLFISLVVLLGGTFNSHASSYPENNWRISVSMPTFYPIKVTQAYGSNERNNWVSAMHNYTQFMRISELDRVRFYLPSYDGFGLPLNDSTLIRSRQITPVKQLPDTIYMSWVSLFNTQFYVTKYTLPQSLKDIMNKKVSYTRDDGFFVKSCYRTELIFGLLPDGQSKVWLKGCGELIYISSLEPDSVLDRDSDGFSADTYKKASYLNRIQKRAESEGAVLDPIPWDKVNKVYSGSNKVTNLQ